MDAASNASRRVGFALTKEQEQTSQGKEKLTRSKSQEMELRELEEEVHASKKGLFQNFSQDMSKRPAFTEGPGVIVEEESAGVPRDDSTPISSPLGQQARRDRARTGSSASTTSADFSARGSVLGETAQELADEGHHGALTSMSENLTRTDEPSNVAEEHSRSEKPHLGIAKESG